MIAFSLTKQRHKDFMSDAQNVTIDMK